MFLELSVILILQLTLNVSLLRLTYLKYFFLFDYQNRSSICIIILTVFAMVLDFIKTTSSLILFQNKWSEKYNEMKILGYLINISAVIITQYRTIWGSVVLTAVFGLYYLLRIKFQMVNQTTQEYFEIMYMCGFSMSVSNIIRIFYGDIHVVYEMILLIGFLIIHFSLQFYGILRCRISNYLENIN